MDVRQQDPEELLLSALRSRGLAAPWTDQASPRAVLTVECDALEADLEFLASLSAYLAKNPVIVQSLKTVLAQLAFSAGIHWRQAPEVLRPLARPGWHLGRWLPTFLIIDGPLGRLLRDKDSPLSARLKVDSTSFPLLCGVRDLFNQDLFRRVRNGFAHWSFTWQDHGNSAKIEIVNWQTGVVEAQLTLLEAEALHFVTASAIQIIDQSLLRQASGG